MNDIHNSINSSISPDERVFISPYAPLSPEGPLPPGLTEAAVANAYKRWGIHPKRVLFNMKIKHFTEPTIKRLRKAVDKPEARRSREIGGKTSVPAFYDALLR